jgi:chromosome segregation ATPase
MLNERSGLSLMGGQVEDGLAGRRAAVEQAEKSLRTQRTEVLRMMGELRQLQESVRRGDAAEALRQENEELRRALAEREQPAADPTPPAERVEELERLRGEAEALRSQVADKDALLGALGPRPVTGATSATDLESYEAELNQFHQQLQKDRRRLNEDLEQFRVRKEELDQATREMEMQLSRERAELARERTHLERLREEVRGELERCQRGAAVLNRLAPVQRLRDEFLDRRGPAQPR